jgi:leucine-zipper-like transcriptional regulator 1
MFNNRLRFGLVILIITLALTTISACFPKLGQDWELITDDPGWEGREGHAAVVFDDKMWILGGSYQIDDTNYFNFNDVWSSEDGVNWTEVRANDTNSDNWGVTIWNPGEGHSALAFNDKLWVIQYEEVWSSSDGVDWTLESTAGPGKIHPASAVYDGKMWIVGGNSNAYWSSDGITWNEIVLDHSDYDNMWEERKYFSALVYQDKLWILGGNEPGIFGQYKHDVWYTTDGENWVHAENGDWEARWGFASVVYEDKMWVMGGYAVVGWQDEALMNDVWMSPDGEEWERSTYGAQWGQRRLHAGLVFNDRIWIIGGYGLDGNGDRLYYNDVWRIVPLETTP